ncbi:unnamed protein product [Ectocarpus sp. CCAP 1310/34]|nr:unnamed protein product [Ectocarpus sp. CCAP 1310/34]
MGATGLTGSKMKKWAPRSVQGLFLTMVLAQRSLAMPTVLDEQLPVIEHRDGKGDEAAATPTTIASGRDGSRQNRPRRKEYPYSRKHHQRHQQWRAEQEHAPYTPVSSRSYRNQQGWGREHRKLDRATEGDPGLSLVPKMPEDGDNSFPQIYRAPTDPPTNGSCPVAVHNSNSAALNEDRDSPEPSTAIVGAFPVWVRLQQAATVSSRLRCPSPPCCLGDHVHTYRGGDLGEEMSHIQGAVVVRRTDLARAPGTLAPAHDVDFVRTFQSYFPISRSSLLRGMLEADEQNMTSTTTHTLPKFPELLGVTSFLGAVREGNPAAAELLTPYCSGEDPRQDIDDCVRIPTLVSMANVYISRKGAVWNENDYILPLNCATAHKHEGKDFKENAVGPVPTYVKRYEKVFVMTQDWGPNYYHFTVEHLPRITLALDILLENSEIMIAVHYHDTDKWHDTSTELEAHMGMFEILGISRERIILVKTRIYADLVIVPTTTVCGDPDAHMVNMLRNRFLQGLFPTTNGVPPAPPRPVIVLVVRTTLRGLKNNDEVREALQINFPSFDVVEFFGTDPVRDQLKTFATAAMIIAPHGAGLANVVVAPLHTPVLEIAPIRCPPCFLRLSLKLHHVYARHPGGKWKKRCQTWYKPDVDEIVTLARDLLEGKRQADDAVELQAATDPDASQP